VFLNLRHDSLQTEEDWCEWWTKMTANLNVLKKNYKKIAFYPNRKIFSQNFFGWNVELDEGKKIDIMGTLTKQLLNMFQLWCEWGINLHQNEYICRLAR